MSYGLWSFSITLLYYSGRRVDFWFSGKIYQTPKKSFDYNKNLQSYSFVLNCFICNSMDRNSITEVKLTYT